VVAGRPRRVASATAYLPTRRARYWQVMKGPSCCARTSACDMGKALTVDRPSCARARPREGERPLQSSAAAVFTGGRGEGAPRACRSGRPPTLWPTPRSRPRARRPSFCGTQVEKVGRRRFGAKNDVATVGAGKR
jgi:hypothetical protein